tara:strand:+ start:52368 stop:52910 length:543 start_codon:yes stop_codon:yes gene_type:complete
MKDLKELEKTIKHVVRDVKDFPKEGILFKDVSTILMDPQLSNDILDAFVSSAKEKEITKVVGIESRGFLFGPAIAMKLGVPFVMLRKEGKLPYKKVKYAYDLEYGKAVVEVHEDAFQENDNVLIHDDLLATGGTAEAAAQLVKQFGANVAEFSFLIDLSFLNGQEKLEPFTEKIVKLATY